MGRPQKSKGVFDDDILAAADTEGSAYDIFLRMLDAYRIHWRMSALARKAGYRVETLSAIVCKQPKVAANFSTVEAVLDAMGYRLQIVRKESA